MRAEPQLVGPDKLCIVFGGVVGTFSAGGDDVDVYDWVVTDQSSGEVIFEKTGGAQLETIQVVFSAVGTYDVQLKVRRGTNADYYQGNLQVTVQQGPALALLADYLLCAGGPAVLTALHPDTPNFSDFIITWKDIEGNVIGTGNQYLAYGEGYHLVEIYQTQASGEASCLITGSAFVAPPVDFHLTPSTLSICEGQAIHVDVDTPITGEWFVQKGYDGARTPLGPGFEIDVSSSSLTDPGLYFITFQTKSQRFPDCLSERMVGFELVESPDIAVTIVNAPNSCEFESGAIQINVNSDIDNLHIPELGIDTGPMQDGDQLNFDDLEASVYTLKSTKSGCETTQMSVLQSTDPSGPGGTAAQQTEITVEPESCTDSGLLAGKVNLIFDSEISGGTYRILATGKGEVRSDAIPDSREATFDLGGGNYLLEVVVDGCNFSVKDFTVGRSASANFTVPTDYNICETFSFSPETNQNLRFTLTHPDGSTQVKLTGETFSLTEEGTYTIIGESNDPSIVLCPKQVSFSTTYSSSISFSPVLSIEKCFDPIRYQLDLQGISPDDASIRWYNDQGEIVGRGQEFYPPGVGFYSLLVQPLKSGFCPVTPVEFEVVNPVTSVPMELAADKICPQPEYASVRLTTNESEVSDTEWIFYDLQDNREELNAFDDLFEIEVVAPGTYEVVAYNRLGCEIGRNLIAVEESMLLSVPSLEDRYGVCSEGKTGPTLTPGDYAEYYWYWEGALVSTDASFVPKEIGSYTLDVVSQDGCAFSASFETFDACDFEYVFPNAMTLGDPSRSFEVRVSEGVSEAELHIINRQGALVHVAKTQEIPVGDPILHWDGTSNGKYITPGTYVVIVIVRNPAFQFEKKITSSLLVLQ